MQPGNRTDSHLTIPLGLFTPSELNRRRNNLLDIWWFIAHSPKSRTTVKVCGFWKHPILHTGITIRNWKISIIHKFLLWATNCSTFSFDLDLETGLLWLRKITFVLVCKKPYCKRVLFSHQQSQSLVSTSKSQLQHLYAQAHIRCCHGLWVFLAKQFETSNNLSIETSLSTQTQSFKHTFEKEFRPQCWSWGKCCPLGIPYSSATVWMSHANPLGILPVRGSEVHKGSYAKNWIWSEIS